MAGLHGLPGWGVTFGLGQATMLDGVRGVEARLVRSGTTARGRVDFLAHGIHGRSRLFNRGRGDFWDVQYLSGAGALEQG